MGAFVSPCFPLHFHKKAGFPWFHRLVRNACLVGLLVPNGGGCWFPEAVNREDCWTEGQGDSPGEKGEIRFHCISKMCCKNCARWTPVHSTYGRGQFCLYSGCTFSSHFGFYNWAFAVRRNFSTSSNKTAQNRGRLCILQINFDLQSWSLISALFVDFWW